MSEPLAMATGRSSRARLLAAAVELFYRNGIQATGVSELCERAGVSKRTLYQLYGGKDALVAAYLSTMRERRVLRSERVLFTDSVQPIDRLLGLFDLPEPGFRGCPFHNAAVELTTPGHPALAVVTAYKADFLARLVESARQAGCREPETLGYRLMVLYDGATALATSTGDNGSYDIARPLAVELVQAAR